MVRTSSPMGLIEGVLLIPRGTWYYGVLIINPFSLPISSNNPIPSSNPISNKHDINNPII
ncbi:hypothetical protein RHMOL_Rhmol04G0154100 [Rhododendron molle]|uniref:Uncharacterized protein n=1 Tax=Rhododendron molle TaxID=49168 RepID=A0ACC0P2C6_RHOML|nr:hypothetical protein RHMOL_Rhmol04G0154100 [Rhododendron molle]